jgi:HAMP domain-containing protein
VAAEEDAQIRSAAARRYAGRIIAAAQHAAATRLEAPSRERDRLVHELEAMRAARDRAADALEQVIAELQHAADGQADKAGASEAACGEAAPNAAASAPEVVPVELPPTAADAAPAARHSTVPAWGERATASAAGESSPARKGPAPRRIRIPQAAGAAAAVLLLLQGSAGAPPSGRGPSGIAAAGLGPVSTAATPAIPRALDQLQPDSPAASDGAAPAAAREAGRLTMHIKPLRRCWVRVVVDDRTDAREIEPGEDIRLEARRTIVLRVGDAGALSVELNGRVLPPLGQDGQVVERRFTADAK